MARKISAIQLARRITLGIVLVGMTTMTVLHQKLQGIPSIDALDPFGGLETLMKFLASGEFIKRIEPGNVVLLGGIVALAVVLSRFFCGWFCAFGALQGVFGWIGKKLLKRRLEVPKKLDRVLRFAKYPILVAIAVLTWVTGSLIIRPYDPLAAYGHLSAGLPAVWAEFSVGFVILVAILALSALYERAFCKYLCPLGALNAIIGRIPIFRVKRVAATCVSCAACDRACPMNIDVANADAVGSAECIACMECVTACPTKKDTLVATLGGKAVKTGTVVAIGFAIFAGAALIGQAAGMLSFVAPTLQSIAKEGNLRVEDIKGSSTYGAVAESFGVDLGLLYREIGITADAVPPGTQIKDTAKLLGMEEFEADAVRVAVAKILGVPYAGESGTAPTEVKDVPPAAETKVAEPKAPEPQADAPTVRPAAPKASLSVPADFALEGSMSVNDVAAELNAGAEAVIEKLGLPPDVPRDTPLRDLKDAYGFSMATLKEKIKQ